jgi:hypothetical protein
MIYTKRLITIRNASASIDAQVVLYRGDKEVEIIFEIIDSKFKFESSSGNLIDNSHASYGQMVIACPNGSNTVSNVMECENGLITFVMTGAMMDELTEVGEYSFQIRLFNDTKTSRITLPIVTNGIEVKEPIVAN